MVPFAVTLAIKGIYVCFLPCHRPLEEPKLISAFSGKQAGKHVVHIACGSTYSAAITAEGELYTWGRGNYGRLGHGRSVLQEHQPVGSSGLSLLGRT